MSQAPIVKAIKGVVFLLAFIGALWYFLLAAFVTAFDSGMAADSARVVEHRWQQLALLLSGTASLVGKAGVVGDRRTLLWAAVLLVAGLTIVVTANFTFEMGTLQFLAATFALLVSSRAPRA